MSKLRGFVAGAAAVAFVQETILNAMDDVFESSEVASLEAALLAPGYAGWEARAIQLIKSQVKETHKDLEAHVRRLQEKFKATVPYPGQGADYWVDPLSRPHLRAYYCLRCGFKMTSLALAGICCHGQPECSRCKHQVHEASCKRVTTAEKLAPKRKRQSPEAP